MYSAPIGEIMHSTGRPICALLFWIAVCTVTLAQNQPSSQPSTADKPRVFITDSQSWEMSGSGGGANGAWGAQTHGGARPQTAETIKPEFPFWPQKPHHSTPVSPVRNTVKRLSFGSTPDDLPSAAAQPEMAPDSARFCNTSPYPTRCSQIPSG